VNAAERRILLPLLKRIHKGEAPNFRMRSAAEHLIYRFSKPASKSKKAARVRKEGKAATHRDSTARIREAVMQRANGTCECGCGSDFIDMAGLMPHFDHWLGGVGRRKVKQSIETCWAITSGCHFMRTTNNPSAEAWNGRFRLHCEKHGYPFQAHIEHKEIP
jgi:hypothetical protein